MLCKEGSYVKGCLFMLQTNKTLCKTIVRDYYWFSDKTARVSRQGCSVEPSN